ncbi:hypothetical protein Nepgr_033921 [Nepenthes gracilis]|uniref:Exocyst subunit Exo70 family protein n=1 Tax=Nepenthes gracilis TaxID=150966 RepID=A0AAD3TMA7_NEPGR|nr:hypothetical protein Nepgr_033921 [Nepenthes gracilis]
MENNLSTSSEKARINCFNDYRLNHQLENSNNFNRNNDPIIEKSDNFNDNHDDFISNFDKFKNGDEPMEKSDSLSAEMVDKRIEALPYILDLRKIQSSDQQIQAMDDHGGENANVVESCLWLDGQEPSFDDVDEIDRLISSLSSIADKSNPLEIPGTRVETFAQMVQSRIDEYESGSFKFGQNSDQDSILMDVLSRISKLTKLLGELSSGSAKSLSSKTSVVLQRAMMFMEEELQIFLEESKQNASKDPETKITAEEELFPAISDEAISRMKNIASLMISAGSYYLERQSSAAPSSATFLQSGRDEHQPRHGGDPIIPQFRRLYCNDQAFCERLFKVPDIYETPTELISAFDDSLYSKECADALRSDISAVRRRLGEAVVCIFYDLENSIRSDVAGNPVPTARSEQSKEYLLATGEKRNDPDEDDVTRNNNNQKVVKISPFAEKMTSVMELLDANLEVKSKLYKDPSLRYIFMMNNGRYILQKIKESTEIHELLGDSSVRKLSSELRGYHKNYQRETWSKGLQCLSYEGSQVNGKVHKPTLKERFKNFNKLFDDIDKTHSTWVVNDGQLQSELRVSISAVMIPAYRSFLARFGHYLTAGRQEEKYIKYQPEDIEAAIEELFDGNPAPVAEEEN